MTTFQYISPLCIQWMACELGTQKPYWLVNFNLHLFVSQLWMMPPSKLQPSAPFLLPLYHMFCYDEELIDVMIEETYLTCITDLQRAFHIFLVKSLCVYHNVKDGVQSHMIVVVYFSTYIPCISHVFYWYYYYFLQNTYACHILRKPQLYVFDDSSL